MSKEMYEPTPDAWTKIKNVIYVPYAKVIGRL